MDTEGALIVDLRRPDWADAADTILRGLATDPPKMLIFEANDAAAPSAEEGQLIFALTKFAAAADLPFELSGQAEEFTAGFEMIGFDASIFAQGDLTQ